METIICPTCNNQISFPVAIVEMIAYLEMICTNCGEVFIAFDNLPA